MRFLPKNAKDDRNPGPLKRDIQREWFINQVRKNFNKNNLAEDKEKLDREAIAFYDKNPYHNYKNFDFKMLG